MNKVKTFIKNEITGWNSLEVFWLSLAVIVITALSIYWGDSLMGIISATTGVACVVCTGKGKLSAYTFGLVNSVLYAIIAYKARYLGDFTLNLLYYSPMQIWGFYYWSKHINPETNEVYKKRMSNKNRCILFLSVAIGTGVYGFILDKFNGNLPYVDALSTVVSVVAMIVSIKMYMEQWILWIFVDIVTIIMWAVAFINSNENISTLLMWIIFLLNAIFAYIKWNKEAKENNYG